MQRHLSKARDQRSQRGQRGLTLLELVVAVMVLSLGALAAIRGSDQARIGIGGAEPRILAQIAAENHAAQLQFLGPAALPPQVTLGRAQIRIDTRFEATAGALRRATITARAAQGAGQDVGAVLVVYLPGTLPGISP